MLDLVRRTRCRNAPATPPGGGVRAPFDVGFRSGTSAGVDRSVPMTVRHRSPGARWPGLLAISCLLAIAALPSSASAIDSLLSPQLPSAARTARGNRPDEADTGGRVEDKPGRRRPPTRTPCTEPDHVGRAGPARPGLWKLAAIAAILVLLALCSARPSPRPSAGNVALDPPSSRSSPPRAPPIPDVQTSAHAIVAGPDVGRR